MNNLTMMNSSIAEVSDTLDSLWAQAEYLGRVEVDRPLGEDGYKAEILLPDYSRVKGVADKDIKVSLADAIRKARLIG